MQEIWYCVEHKAIFLSDDLRLCNFINWKDIKWKAINSFILFQKWLTLWIIDKKQYSLILAEYADFFYQFIPFDGDDLLNIILDDENRQRSNRFIGFEPKLNPDMKISRRVFHMLNQVNLPWSNLESFLKVSEDFVGKLFKLSVLEETKIDWVVFLTNFFSEFISEENFLKNRSAIEPTVDFIVRTWNFSNQSLSSEFKPVIFKKIELIKNELIKNNIKILLDNIG